METPDDIPQLLREAQDRGMRTAAEGLLQAFRLSCRHALEWQRKAGRAFAEEGLETDVLREGIEAWIGRERRALRAALLKMVEDDA